MIWSLSPAVHIACKTKQQAKCKICAKDPSWSGARCCTPQGCLEWPQAEFCAGQCRWCAAPPLPWCCSRVDVESLLLLGLWCVLGPRGPQPPKRTYGEHTLTRKQQRLLLQTHEYWESLALSLILRSLSLALTRASPLPCSSSSRAARLPACVDRRLQFSPP